MGHSFNVLLIFALYFYGSVVVGQEKVIEDAEVFSSASFSLDFMTDHDVNGRLSMFENQPTLSGMASYYHKSGFDISTSYSNIWNSNEGGDRSTQYLALSLGYNHDFKEWLSASVMYSQYFYSKDSYSLRSVYKNLISTAVYSEVDWWVSDVMLGYYSGKADEFFIAMETGVSFNMENVIKKGNSLSFHPIISAFMGDINIYNMEAYSSYTFIYNYASLFPEVTSAEFINKIENPVTNREKLLSARIQKQPNKLRKLRDLPDDLILWDLFSERKSFNFKNIGFSLPVYYYWGDFVINVGFSAFHAINQPEYADEEWSGYSNVGLTYFMNW